VGAFHLGHWLVMPSLNTASCKGDTFHLEPKVMAVLVCLAEHGGEPVSKEILLQTVWPDTFVSEGVLVRSIFELRRIFGDDAHEARIIGTIPKRGYRLLADVEFIEPQRTAIPSLLVLPLENLSRDPEQEFLADGLTEALITQFAKIKALRVISRTTAMHYKKNRVPIRDITRELGVQWIVEGTIQRAGETVRVSAQLIDAKSDTHIWAHTYERTIGDVLKLQSDVAQAIARQVQVKVPQEQSQFRRIRSIDPGAYEAYLKGRYYWNKRSGEAIKRAALYFQQAIEKDPAYAAPYAALADCAGVAGFWSLAPPAEACGRAKSLARQAMQMDDSAEAHASLGWALLHYDWDFAAAEREFQLAIGSDSRYATAYQWYGHCLGAMGRFEEAFSIFEQAIRVDPLSLIITTSYAGISWLGRKWDQAIEQSWKVLDLDANFVAGRWALARSYDCKGNRESAISSAQEAVQLAADNLFFLTDLGHAYAAAGRFAEAHKVLTKLYEISKHRYVDPCFLAQINVALGDTDAALKWLEVAYEQRAWYMAYVELDPWFDNLHSNPHFQSLLRKIHSPIGL
jgi:TolB-like protein/Flp pilus assembly protein TadD